jgi:SulP family sulfate permease
VVLKLRRDGATVELLGMNDASSTIVDRLAIHDKVDELDLVPSH